MAPYMAPHGAKVVAGQKLPVRTRVGQLTFVMARRARRCVCYICKNNRGWSMAQAQVNARRRILRLKLNGRWREDAVAENQLLVEYLRDVVRLAGTKTGCDGGECGACTVLVDDQAMPSCIMLAVRCEGRSIETIEGLASQGRLHRLQRAFHDKLGTQCGFCTPGVIMAAEALLRRN